MIDQDPNTSPESSSSTNLSFNSDHHIEPPNYTQIPNVIFDHWMPILEHSEFKVLLCLCRETFGWHRASITMSYNEIIKASGVSRRGVIDGIKSLINLGLVIKKANTKSDGFEDKNTYKLCVKKSRGGSAMVALGGSAMVAPHNKERIHLLKENSSSSPPKPRASKPKLSTKASLAPLAREEEEILKFASEEEKEHVRRCVEQRRSSRPITNQVSWEASIIKKYRMDKASEALKPCLEKNIAINLPKAKALKAQIEKDVDLKAFKNTLRVDCDGSVIIYTDASATTCCGVIGTCLDPAEWDKCLDRLRSHEQ